MKKRFTEEQIIGFLREAEAGLPIKELYRQHGFSEASYYLWRSKFGGMSVSDAKRLKELAAENNRLKKLLAESMLENEVTREARRKKGAVTLAEYVHNGRKLDPHVSCGRRILGDLGQFTPRREAYGKVFAIKRGTQQMPLQGEVLADQPEALEESLSARRVAKSLHASLAFAGRLMTVFGAVVHAGSGLHEHVLDVGEFGNIGHGRRVTAQLAGDDLSRYRAGTQHSLEEPFGRSLVAPLL